MALVKPLQFPRFSQLSDWRICSYYICRLILRSLQYFYLSYNYLSCDDFEGTFQDLMFKVQPIQVFCRGVLPSIRPESGKIIF
jgi:hypothetical protein